MSDFIFNVAHGKHHYYAGLPGTNDALVLVLLQTAEADDALRDYDTLAAVLAGSNAECDFTGYARATLANVAVTVDDTNNRSDADADDPGAYTNTGASAQAAVKAIVCYDPDTTGGTDADLIPLYGYDCAVTFDPDVATTVAFNANGIGRAA